MKTLFLRLRGDERGLTLVEISIALLLLSIGLVSILALFPKGLYSTRRVMELTTASGVARSAMASILADALDGDIDDDPESDPPDLEWHADYDGNQGDLWWPGARPDDVSFSGTIKTMTVNGVDSCDIRTGNIGDWKTSDSVAAHSWKHNIKHYFLLVNSGRGSGWMCQISGLDTNVDTTDDEVITVPALKTDLEAAGVRAGDKFRIVGPGCTKPVCAVALEDGEPVYSWLAVVGGNSIRMLKEEGTADRAYGNTLTDEGIGWITDEFKGDGASLTMELFVETGPASPRWLTILSNTCQTITVKGWGTSAIGGFEYDIYDRSDSLHPVIILVYGRDFDPGISNPQDQIGQVNACKPAYFFNSTIWGR